jgi:opacity protein-like surface antigen
MFRLSFRARATLLAALLGFFGAPAQAADFMADLPEAPSLPEEPVEWGENWYLRGDVGFQDVRVPALSGYFDALSHQNILSGGVGGGYQFNEWIRADLTIDRSVFRRSGITAQVWCPYQMIGLYRTFADDTQIPIGVLANPSDGCSQFGSASLNRTSGLANVYLDVGHFWGFTPYLGAGLGLTYNSASSSVAFLRNTDGALWAPDLTLPNGQIAQWVYPSGAPYPIQLPFGPTNWNTNVTKSSWSFAWNLMAGVSYDVARNLKVDVGYRYLNAGSYTGLPVYLNGVYVAPVTKDVTSHEVRVGFRVTAN